MEKWLPVAECAVYAGEYEEGKDCTGGKDMRVMRLIVYEGDLEWVEKTLFNSLKNGKKEVGPGRSIIAFTLGDIPSSIELLVKETNETIKKDGD